MKNVEGLIKHLARNPGFGAYLFLEELKTILGKCKRTTLAKFGMDALKRDSSANKVYRVCNFVRQFPFPVVKVN